ncbi:MAG: hypothetical protein ONB25_09150 [candidate division KSB1 bacterium]|nr:hypothetical protein [candidate division KSB1 bacterium]MDZ7414329.1 hypothetical protein [candidate division KSB1 bacterium]
MSCYLRHLSNELAEAGIKVDAANKRQVDQLLHKLVGVPYKSCPSAWKKLKEELRGSTDRRAVFLARLRQAWQEETS